MNIEKVLEIDVYFTTFSMLIVDKKLYATFYLDPYPREGKMAGWWIDVGRGLF